MPQKKPLTRKRSLNKENWEKNKRKRAHQSGDVYINSRGKYVQQKQIKMKKDCKSSCKFKCSEKISRDTQEKTFLDFYKMDTNAKHSYINKTSVCVSIKPSKSCKGKKIDTIENPTRRKKKSYSFYIIDGENSAKVCKDFFFVNPRYQPENGLQCS